METRTKQILIGVAAGALGVGVILAIVLPLTLNQEESTYDVAMRILAEVPLVDGLVCFPRYYDNVFILFPRFKKPAAAFAFERL